MEDEHDRMLKTSEMKGCRLISKMELEPGPKTLKELIAEAAAGKKPNKYDLVGSDSDSEKGGKWEVKFWLRTAAYTENKTEYFKCTKKNLMQKIHKRLEVPTIEIDHIFGTDDFPISSDNKAVCPECGAAGVPLSYDEDYIICKYCRHRYHITVLVATDRS